METPDPREALKSDQIPVRSAGARDLAVVGAWGDVAALVKLAMEDKSPAVRLYTAAAAADILARQRGAAGQAPLSASQKEQVQTWVKSLDPERNPGMLMLLSAVADRASIDRLGRNLTKSADNGVRAGAATALRRMALSAAPFDEDYLVDSARKWLSGKVPPDVPVEIGKLAGEVGWSGFDELLRTLSAGTKAQIAAAAEAKKQLDARSGPAGWEGIWESDGKDVLEVNADAAPAGWVAIADGQWWAPPAPGKARRKATKGEPTSAAHRPTPITVEGLRASVGGRRLRMVFAPKVGEPDLRAPAVQLDGVTYWKRDGKALAEWVEANQEAIDAVPALMLALARWLEAQDNAAAQRARAILLWKGGDAAGARRLLDDQVANKKPKADVYLLLAKVCVDLKDKKAAKVAIEQFLEKAGKKADGRKEAEDLLKKLK